MVESGELSKRSFFSFSMEDRPMSASSLRSREKSSVLLCWHISSGKREKKIFFVMACPGIVLSFRREGAGGWGGGRNRVELAGVDPELASKNIRGAGVPFPGLRRPHTHFN